MTPARTGRRWALVVFQALILAQAVAATGCKAQQADRSLAQPQQFEPAETRALREFGAAGDGRTDDTAALTRAFSNSGRFCLDGKGATYRIIGTLRVSNSLCLRNAVLVQGLVPFDTSPYVARDCGRVDDPSGLADCGDPAIPADQLGELGKSLGVRTLLIRPEEGGGPIRVNLENVTVNRGRYPQGGSRSDSAGIWLDGAERVDFRNVEITGSGKGYGLLLIKSKNVTLSNLSIHDLAWAPYRGEPGLTQARVSAAGWNRVPIHEFRDRGVATPKFYGVRVQEQVACLFLAEVERVRIHQPRIARCVAKFEDGDIPWQADGIIIGGSSSNIIIDGGTIDSTWEGVDAVGGGSGIDGLVIKNMVIANSFGFAVKLGYRIRRATVSGLTIVKAGISGVVLHGPVSETRIAGVVMEDIGSVNAAGRLISPWPILSRAGIRLDVGQDSDGTVKAPANILVEDVRVSGSAYSFGLLNTGGTGLRTQRFRATGFRKAEIQDGGNAQ